MCELIDCSLNPGYTRKINFRLSREKEAEGEVYVLDFANNISFSLYDNFSLISCSDSMGDETLISVSQRMKYELLVRSNSKPFVLL